MKAFIIFIIILGFILYVGIVITLFFFGVGEQKAKKSFRIIAVVGAAVAIAVMIKAINYLFRYGCPL